jgi:hypothetical protein
LDVEWKSKKNESEVKMVLWTGMVRYMPRKEEKTVDGGG